MSGGAGRGCQNGYCALVSFAPAKIAPRPTQREAMARPLNRLPPLNALRAFVAAAKHLSFSKAAAELHVTPAAVSQQVKQLEDHLGCALFKRTSRNLLLTDEGQACLPGLAEAFDKLGEALGQIRLVG